MDGQNQDPESYTGLQRMNLFTSALGNKVNRRRES